MSCIFFYISRISWRKNFHNFRFTSIFRWEKSYRTVFNILKPFIFFCSSASRLYYINNGYCTHLCLLNPFGYRCACPDKEDTRPCSTVPAPPTTTAAPTTTALPTKYCANPDICQHDASCSISRDSTLGYECECVGYFFGTHCELVLGKLPNFKLSQVDKKV